jgi:hypothetical protein
MNQEDFHSAAATKSIRRQLKDCRCTIDLAGVTYFVGHETLTRREDSLARAFRRNGAEFFPSDRLLQSF